MFMPKLHIGLIGASVYHQQFSQHADPAWFCIPICRAMSIVLPIRSNWLAVDRGVPAKLCQ